MNKSVKFIAKYLIVIITTTFWSTSGHGYQPHGREYIFTECSSCDLTVIKKIAYSELTHGIRKESLSKRELFTGHSYITRCTVSAPR